MDRRRVALRFAGGFAVSVGAVASCPLHRVGNDQLNDVWREVQLMAGIDRPVTVHGIRHSFHNIARQQGVPDAVVKAIAGRAGTEVAQRGQDKHLHYSRGVSLSVNAVARLR